MHTKFASITSGNEIVVVSSFNIELGASGGKLNICLPYSMIEPVRDLLTRPLQNAGAHAIDPRWQQQLSRQVRRADVQLAADLTHLNNNQADPANMRTTDILPIHHSPTTTNQLDP